MPNTISAQGTSQATAGATAAADTRYSFVAQHLVASAIFVRKLRAIESTSGTGIDETTHAEHRGLACAVVMQCAAALETEAHEVCTYGPGAHLGSNGIDQQALAFLKPLADVIDDQQTVARFQLILHLLGRPRLDEGDDPFRSAALVIRLRNEITHYKSRWGAETAGTKLFASLEQLRHQPPPFADATMNFFPHRCLSAACSAWALKSTVAFLEAFYAALGTPSRLAPYSTRLVP